MANKRFTHIPTANEQTETFWIVPTLSLIRFEDIITKYEKTTVYSL